MGRTNNLLISTALTVLLMITFGIDPAEADQGLFIGVEMVFNDIGGELNAGNAIASGNGGGLTGGYRFNDTFALEASYWVTDHALSGGRSVELTCAALSVKASLPLANSHVEPYLLVGAGKYQFDATRGEGWHYGAGVDIHLFPSLDLTIGLAKRSIDFGTAPAVSAAVTSMEIGLTYRFI
ncbi:MAG: outer membrane beta-barrel protein [Nitrospirae bacterium]|nr:outer membrane beta-barrel protein [Nitrospirota bacterium]NTW65916.1 outer membrane beta-barrel protein [Nitrospirota bacterium]